MVNSAQPSGEAAQEVCRRVREEDGAFFPDRAVLFGEENAELSALLTQELGIAPEKQEWRAER